MSTAVRTRTGWSLAHIVQSPEYRIAVELDELEAALGLHKANYRDLQRLTTELVAEAGRAGKISRLRQLWSWDNRRELERMWTDAGRLLHNYLASAYTLMEHTRRHIERLYAGSPFGHEYEKEKKDQLTNCPVVRFITDLRVYNQHHRLPLVGGELSVDVDKLPESRVVRSRVCLDVKDLLTRGRKWSRHSREYLASAGNWLPVDKLAEEYMRVISPFYSWLRSGEREIHKNALRRHKRRIARVRAQRNGASGGS